MGRSPNRRVVVIVQNLPLRRDRRVRLECAALVQAGFDVTAICPRDMDVVDQSVPGVDVRHYAPPPAADGFIGYLVEFAYCWLATAALLVRYLARNGVPACIQACNPPDTFWALAILLRPFGTRFVYDQHDLNPEVYASRFDHPNPVLAKGLLLLERASYATAHEIIVTNASYGSRATGRGRQPESKVTIVRSGPNRTMKRAEPDPALRLGRDHLCCWIGVMGPQDGVDLLLRAVAHYVHVLGRDDCTFALLGTGDSYDELLALCEELDLDKHVVFAGWADDALLGSYLSTADLGLSPDPQNPLNEVSTMNKVMEYMAYGIPVVAFDLTETRVSGGASMVYVTPDDTEAFAEAVAATLDDRALRHRLGDMARLRILVELCWEEHEPVYVSVFDRLLGDA
jgi:glycosyltransferase involved in cell wall biosynthesis